MCSMAGLARAGLDTNLFSFLQQRRQGGRRHRCRDTQLTMLRLKPRWSAPRMMPGGSSTVKHVVLLTEDVFCLVRKGGRADAFAANGDVEGGTSEEQPLRWLADLNVYEGEKMRLVAHMCISNSLLTVFSISGRSFRGSLFVRVLDVASVIAGQLRTRDVGSLASTVVPTGGFVEFDAMNSCIWANDCQMLRCWDACTFEQRFALGPWQSEEMPNVRFTRGIIGLLSQPSPTMLDVKLYSSLEGRLQRQCEVHMPTIPDSDVIVFLELMNEQLLLKRLHCEVSLVDLVSGNERVIPGTANWEPDMFVFSPARRLLLARFAESVEIWQLSEPNACSCIGVVRPLHDFGAHRFSIDMSLALALVVRPASILRPRRPSAAYAAATPSSSPPPWLQRLGGGSPQPRQLLGLGSLQRLSTIAPALLAAQSAREYTPPPPLPGLQPASVQFSQDALPPQAPRLQRFSFRGRQPLSAPASSRADWDMSAEEATAAFGEDLDLLDLLCPGKTRATIGGVCSGIGGGGVAHMSFDPGAGVLMLLGNKGGISVHSAGFQS